MKVLLAAGGTGGHIFPALAVADALKKRGADVFFVGVGKELERKLIPSAGYRLNVIPFSPVTGKGIVGLFRTALSFPTAIRAGLSLLRAEKVDVVFAFGGYPSFVPFLSACLKRIPRALHEQNVQVGLANKFAAMFSERVFAVPGARGFFASAVNRVEFVPNPVRAEFYAAPEWAAPKAGEPLRILVVGGSQGATSLNSAVLACAPLMASANIALVHQTGASDLERVAAFYRERSYSWAEPRPFIDGLAAEYARAHLVISRAGAMSAAEIAAAGRPAIFVPLAIAQGHQAENIRALLEAGAAIKIDQNEQTGAALESTLKTLFAETKTMSALAARARELSRVGKQSSAEFLAEQIIALAKR